MNKAAHQKLDILVNNKPALQTRRKLAKNTQDRPTVGHKKQLSKIKWTKRMHTCQTLIISIFKNSSKKFKVSQPI